MVYLVILKADTKFDYDGIKESLNKKLKQQIGIFNLSIKVLSLKEAKKIPNLIY